MPSLLLHLSRRALNGKQRSNNGRVTAYLGRSSTDSLMVGVQDSGNSKIPELDGTIFVVEYICCLDVTVKHAIGVKVVQCLDNLCKPSKDIIFFEVVIAEFSLFNFLRKVTVICIPMYSPSSDFSLTAPCRERHAWYRVHLLHNNDDHTMGGAHRLLEAKVTHRRR